MPIRPPEILLPLGQVVHDQSGLRYVFCGYRTSSVSTGLAFVCGEERSLYAVRDYHGVHRETLIRKFPDILDFEEA